MRACQEEHDVWTQGLRSLSDVESELRAAVGGRSKLLDAKSMMIDFGENRAEKRKGECNTADIGTKAVTAELPRRHFETSKMGCGDVRVPPTLRAMPWLRRLELGETSLEPANL